MVLILIAILVISLDLMSAYYPRHRIIKHEQCGKTWYVPQETTVLWSFWRDMQYPYSERTYSFDTLEEAEKFLESLNEDKIKKTVVK